MKSLGVTPDGFLGHSLGELACGYVDGGLTLEETLKAAYWRAKCVTQANTTPGAMYAVGKLLPTALDQQKEN